MLNLEDIESAKVLKMHTITKSAAAFLFSLSALSPHPSFSWKKMEAAQTHFVQLHVTAHLLIFFKGPMYQLHICRSKLNITVRKAWTSSKLLVYIYKSKLNFTVRKAWTSSKLLVYSYKFKLNITVRKAWTSSKLLFCTDKFKLNFHSM